MSFFGGILDLWRRGAGALGRAFDDGKEAAPLVIGKDDVSVPINPNGAINMGIAILLITFGGFGTWAATAQLNSAVIANGDVTVFSSRKKVQHLEGGIVTEILVQNGDRVKKDQVLVRLDSTRAGADVGRAEGQYNQARATVARLIAERDGLDEIQFPEDLLAKTDQKEVADLIEGQKVLFQARRQSVQGQLNLINEQITQLEEEIRGFEAQRRARRQQIGTIEEELKDKKVLHEKGWVSRTEIMAIERQRSQYAGDIGDLTARIANAKARIGEARLQLLQVEKSVREQVVTELRQRQTEMYDLAETYEKYKFSLDHTDVRASHDGIIVNKQVTTVGQVIRPGELLLEIVPENETLIIEAKVNPMDVDVLKVGQRADVQITAFKRRTTKKLRGELAYVSADALKEETQGRAISYYLARITVPESELKTLDENHRLQPGMPATVFIQTGSRTPLAYLLQPLNDSFAHAWRES